MKPTTEIKKVKMLEEDDEFEDFPAEGSYSFPLPSSSFSIPKTDSPCNGQNPKSIQ